MKSGTSISTSRPVCSPWRPASIGNHNTHFFWSMTFSGVFIGTTLAQAILYQIISIILYFALAILYRPMITDIELYTFTGTIIFSIVAAQHHNLQLAIFTNIVKNREAYVEQKQLHKVIEAIHESLIPRSIQKESNLWARRHEGHVDVWGSSDCVVISLQIHQDQKTLASLAKNSPAELRAYAENSVRIVEHLIPKLRHGSLSIVKVFGGVMTIAGPLRESKEITTVHATEDTFELLSQLRQETVASIGIAASHKEGSGGQNNKFIFTAAVVTDFVLNVLRVTDFPTYELMGPAVNLSRAMMLAAPAPMMVVTEKMSQFYKRECNKDDVGAVGTGARSYNPSSPTTACTFGDGESWRLRDAGIVRVCGVRFDDGGVDTTGEGSVSETTVSVIDSVV